MYLLFYSLQMKLVICHICMLILQPLVRLFGAIYKRDKSVFQPGWHCSFQVVSCANQWNVKRKKPKKFERHVTPDKNGTGFPVLPTLCRPILDEEVNSRFWRVSVEGSGPWPESSTKGCSTACLIFIVNYLCSGRIKSKGSQWNTANYKQREESDLKVLKFKHIIKHKDSESNQSH